MTSLAGKRVMVTGGTGFLGSEVCRLLRARSVELIVPRHRDYDLTEQDAVRRLMAETKPEIVVHLAAEVGGIGANRDNPGRYFYANAAMGINVIESSRLAGVEKFVQVGTVCAYPKYTPVPFKETDIWDGFPEETNAPYGIAKKALLVMLQAYRTQYDFNGIYLLPVNLYGPGDNFDLRTSHVIPALIRKFVDAQRLGAGRVDLWGTGSPSREFLHVRDAARAIALATERYDDSEPVNIGTGREIKIRELADLISGFTGYGGSIHWDTDKPDGQPRRVLDTDRAKKSFGFEAEITLEDGLRETVRWWRDREVS